MTPLEEARRLVIKIGSSILVDETRGEVRRDWLESLTDSVARLHKGGCEIVLVSSGAIRLGRTQFKLPPGRFGRRWTCALRTDDGENVASLSAGEVVTVARLSLIVLIRET